MSFLFSMSPSCDKLIEASRSFVENQRSMKLTKAKLISVASQVSNIGKNINYVPRFLFFREPRVDSYGRKKKEKKEGKERKERRKEKKKKGKCRSIRKDAMFYHCMKAHYRRRLAYISKMWQFRGMNLQCHVYPSQNRERIWSESFAKSIEIRGLLAINRILTIWRVPTFPLNKFTSCM